MTVEVPLELGHVVARLHSDFDQRLPAGTGTTADEREKHLLTRALVAFAIHRLASCSLDEAAAAVVDGGGDFGLDAIFFSPTPPRYGWRNPSLTARGEDNRNWAT